LQTINSDGETSQLTSSLDIGKIHTNSASATNDENKLSYDTSTDDDTDVDQVNTGTPTIVFKRWPRLKLLVTNYCVILYI